MNHHFSTLIRVGKKAIINNAIPAVILWCVALLLAIGYYHNESMGRAFDAVGRLKSTYGFIFSMCSTALCGGLFPFLLQYIKPRAERTMQPGELAFFMVLWGIKGIEVDALYRLQSHLFGDGINFSIVLMKVFVDLLIYAPLWGVPAVVMAVLWKDCSYSVSSMRMALQRKSFLDRSIPIILLNWFIWFPAVFVIYVMPPALQIVMQNLVLCFFVLLLTFFTESGNRSSDPPTKL